MEIVSCIADRVSVVPITRAAPRSVIGACAGGGSEPIHHRQPPRDAVAHAGLEHDRRRTGAAAVEIERSAPDVDPFAVAGDRGEGKESMVGEPRV